MARHARRSWLLAISLLLPGQYGCGARAVPGGTAGVVHSGPDRLADIQVQLFDARSVLVGFGISNAHGEVRLLKPGAGGPLWLPPGEYRATVESVGPVPLTFPPEYQKPETTPLRIAWSGDGPSFDIDLPPPREAR